MILSAFTGSVKLFQISCVERLYYRPGMREGNIFVSVCVVGLSLSVCSGYNFWIL